jgi:hypothetical protein
VARTFFRLSVKFFEKKYPEQNRFLLIGDFRLGIFLCSDPEKSRVQALRKLGSMRDVIQAEKNIF